MIPSAFILDHRLSELRPTAAELRVARELHDGADHASPPARSIGETVRRWLGGATAESRPSRLATH